MLAQYKKVWQSLYVALFSLLVVDFFWGATNIHLRQQQQAELVQMQVNYQELSHVQEQLEAMKYDYEHNDETMILEARKVGYFRPDEELIVVRGLASPADHRETGQVVRQSTKRASYARWYGIFAFVISFCVVMMLQMFWHKEAQE
jgi:cell division protein FtsB